MWQDKLAAGGAVNLEGMKQRKKSEVNIMTMTQEKNPQKGNEAKCKGRKRTICELPPPEHWLRRRPEHAAPEIQVGGRNKK